MAKYEASGLLPSQLKVSRSYRTRPDPFADDWPQVQDMLKTSPTLEAKAVFEWLCAEHPGQYEPNQLRTFQRRVSDWRALNQEQMLTLEQVRQPGRCMQTDGIDLGQLGILIVTAHAVGTVAWIALGNNGVPRQISRSLRPQRRG